jgi:hypothetical protein
MSTTYRVGQPGKPQARFAGRCAGKACSVAVIIFLAIVLVVIVAWFAIASVRGSKEVVESDTDLQAGHQFPAERGGAPSLLEDDLSFANDESEAARRTNGDVAPR